MRAPEAGLVPPHDMAAEGAVLADALIDGEHFDDMADLLRPEHFYAGRHQTIWAAMAALRGRGEPIDIVTVGSALRAQGRLEETGGMAYLTEILNASPAIANRRAHAAGIVETWRLRRVASICATGVSLVYAGGTASAAVREATETALMAMTIEGMARPAESIGPVVQGAVCALVARDGTTQAPSGMATGVADYDLLTGGLHRSDLTIVAARPGMGKTSLALSWALHAAAPERDVEGVRPRAAVMFSCEMSTAQLGQRTACMLAGVDMRRLRLARLRAEDWKALVSVAGAFDKQAPRLRVDDTPSLNISDLRARVRRQKLLYHREGHDLALVVVDYLQLMKGPPETRKFREQEISAISQGLKSVAKEMDVAVVALSQLNRAVESRPDKRPLLSDLRESGAIEQDADNVVFIYRGAYYAKQAGDAVDNVEREVAELIVAKQRNGPTGTAYARFEEQYARFGSETPGLYNRPQQAAE